MTALETRFATSLANSAPSASRALGDFAPLPELDPRDLALRPLVERVASRISSSCDEVALFADTSCAIDAIVAAFVRGRATVLASPGSEPLASRAWSAARTVKQLDWSNAESPLEALVAAAREAEVLVIASPVLSNGRVSAALQPRDLLRLRSRAPKPLIVLDLMDEEFARAPLTQPALLLPGTVLLRRFGEPWRDAGARAVAPLAFVAGPRELVAPIARAELAEDPTREAALVRAACDELDAPEVDRLIRAAVLATSSTA